jgi:hypothetical protein
VYFNSTLETSTSRISVPSIARDTAKSLENEEPYINMRQTEKKKSFGVMQIHNSGVKDEITVVNVSNLIVEKEKNLMYFQSSDYVTDRLPALLFIPRRI